MNRMPFNAENKMIGEFDFKLTLTWSWHNQAKQEVCDTCGFVFNYDLLSTYKK